MYCQLFTRLYGLRTVSLRYFNVFGPRQRASSPYSGVLSLFIKAALAGAAHSIYGDGEQTRDFTYVDNVVDAVLSAIDAPGVSGEVVNIAAGERISLNQAWESLAGIVGPLPPPAFAPVRLGDVRHSHADRWGPLRNALERPALKFRLRFALGELPGVAVPPVARDVGIRVEVGFDRKYEYRAVVVGCGNEPSR